MIHLAYLYEALAVAERSHIHYIETTPDETTLAGAAIPPDQGSTYATAETVLDVVHRLGLVEEVQSELETLRDNLLNAAHNRRPDYLTKTSHAVIRSRQAIEGVRTRLFETLASPTRAALLDEIKLASTVVSAIDELQSGIKAAHTVHESMTQRPPHEAAILAVSYR